MSRKLFGTDGVRGTANQPPMTPETILRLAQAAILHLTPPGAQKRGVVIGKDTRLSGYLFETALSAGICSMGSPVYLAGPFPTPGVAFLTRELSLDGGIVISASHNPYHDNGIKFFKSDGFKLTDEAEKEIERVMEGDLQREAAPPTQIGKAFRIEDAMERYITFLKSTFPLKRGLDSLKIVVDCAHGAAYRIAPRLLEEMGADVTAIGVQPDGKNINEQCGALHPQFAAEQVVATGADIGIVLDGDADRVVFIDEKGKIYEGDTLLALCAIELQRRGELKNNTVVTTVMSNMGLEWTLAPKGIQVVRTRVGDRYLSNEMILRDCNLGAESSGHFLFFSHNTAGDGMLAALQVLSILTEHQKPLSELLSGFIRFPQVLKSVEVREKRDFYQIPPLRKVIESAENRLNGRGRIFIRYSGTEPLVRILVEGEEKGEIQEIAQEVATTFEEQMGV